ncbi:MAG: tetratricopeptide repeat protein [Aureispira sp.]|nr:tetratricopeptide repeat protein [Aureispira sp.]
MKFFINNIEKAYLAFQQHYFAECIERIHLAFESLEHYKFENLDNTQFNAFYDALEMLELLVRLPIVEQTDYINTTLKRFKRKLNAFMLPSGGDLEALANQVPNLSKLINGLFVGIQYFHKKQIKLNSFPPVLSFELSRNGNIALYAWIDRQPTVSSQPVEQFKTDFEALFKKEQAAQKDYLAQAQELLKNGEAPKAIKILQHAMRVHPAIKKECFLQLGNIHFQENQYAEAVDAYMKALVLGVPKQTIKDKVLTATQQLMSTAKDYKTINRWQELLDNFFS